MSNYYLTKEELYHSRKGSTWKKHKYISKTVKNGKTHYKYPDGNLYYDPDNPDDVYDYDGNLVSPEDVESYTYYKSLRDEDNNSVDKLKKKDQHALISRNAGHVSVAYGVNVEDRAVINHTVYENGKSWLSSTKCVDLKYVEVSSRSGNNSVTRTVKSNTYIHTKGKIEQALDKGKSFIGEALIKIGKKLVSSKKK